MGVAADRGGARVRRDWPIYLRVQLVATAGLLTIFSAWRLSTPSEVVAPVLIAAVGWVLFGAAVVTKRNRPGGEAALECWAAFPNGGFWVLPIAGALVGPVGSMVTARQRRLCGTQARRASTS
jgi:CHASE2 domain-containing sensor protein